MIYVDIDKYNENECMICFIVSDHFTIFQCGHKTCKTCSTKINYCPLCSLEIKPTIVKSNYDAYKILCYGIIAGICIFVIILFFIL